MRTLRQFLIDNKVLDLYCTQVIIQHSINGRRQEFGEITPSRLERIFDVLGMEVGLMSWLLEWSATPQGDRYWRDLSYEWDNELDLISNPNLYDRIKTVL